jgi:hypothetical protein
MTDPYDVPLIDSDLLAEVELCVDLMIAASASPGPLSTEEIDQVLGVAPLTRSAELGIGQLPPGDSTSTGCARRSAG